MTEIPTSTENTRTDSLLLLRPLNTVPGSTDCWRTSHLVSTLLWHRDLRSQLIPGNHSPGSLTQECEGSVFDPSGRNRLVSSDIGHVCRCLHSLVGAFISVLFCLPSSLPVSFCVFVFFPVLQSCIRSFIFVFTLFIELLSDSQVSTLDLFLFWWVL